MTVICYGDSNTYGYDPRSCFGDRYPAEERWPDILQNLTGLEIRNEGMNGREILDYFSPSLQKEDFCIIMLGTNDLLQGADAKQAAKRMEVFLNKIPLDKESILLVSPPALRLGAWVSEKALIEKSFQLSEEYQKLALLMGIHFADSQQWDVAIGFDGVHFTPEGHKTFAKEIRNILHEIFHTI